MLQDFRRRTLPETGGPRLAELRQAMAEAGVDAVLVPRADAHQGETVADRDQRLAWLTGFTGSAGMAIAGLERAVVFVDGRYRLQVQAEVDTALFEIARIPEDRPGDWLAAAGARRVGFDSWLHTRADIEALEARLTRDDVRLVRVANLIDRVWANQPPPPARPVTVHPDALAGRGSAEKRQALAAGLRDRGAAAVVLTLPDSIAWLLNIRGADIARTPVPLGFALLHADARVELFLAPGQITEAVAAHLGPEVTVLPPDGFLARLGSLSGRVEVDRARVPVAVSDALEAAKVEIVWAEDPCLLPKAAKTPAEIAGARAAHLRDAAALATFLAWLDTEAPGGRLTEIEVVVRLEAIRTATGQLRDIAFETIAGAGPNGAIVHYRVNEATNRGVAPGELLLIDSGAQYADGTTDVTRTVATGPAQPPAEAVRAFTLVVEGLSAMSRLRWPEGLAGSHLDAVARAALWQAGLDYDHGTGHGVGAFLSVHEGPAGLSRRSVAPLVPGMILSVEPGVYREGAWGIRVENLVVVTPAAVPEGGDRPMLGFETLTLAPIDRRLLQADLLTPAARSWLDAYHARVLAEVGPLVAPEVRAWLGRACAPL